MSEVAEITVEDLRPELWKDQFWRLNNLYSIVTESGAVVPFKMNEEQIDLFNNLHTRNLILKARQLGFTTLICILALDCCLFTANFSAGIIAHNREDAEKFFRKKVVFAYDRLPHAVRELLPVAKKTESQIEFSNGSTLYVSTSFRGGTLQLLHVSEFGKICRKYPERAKEIVTGALEAVAAGNVAFIESTAEGMSGYFYDYSMDALRLQQEGVKLGALDWRLHFYPWYRKAAYALDENPVITDKQARYFSEIEAKVGVKFTREQKAWWIAKKKQLLGDMGREYPATPQEAFEQAVEGAIYGEQMMRIRELGRITSVPFTPGYPVNTFWDLGAGNYTTVWLHQRVGNQNRWVKFFCDSMRGLDWWWKTLEDWRNANTAVWGKHFLPHDAEASMLGEQITNKRQILEKAGMRNTEIVPRVHDIETGIDITRRVLPADNWFDKEACSEGIKALDAYQYEWDENLGRWKDKPFHNWASDGADAWRQYAQQFPHGWTGRTRSDEDGRRPPRRERNHRVA